MNDYFQVGAITSPHGIKGEVKVFPTTDDAKRYSKLKEVTLGTPDGPVLHVESVKYFKNLVIVKFKEFNTMNDVERLRGKELYVSRENAVKLNKNEFYVADLIGMKVEDEKNGQKGELVDVMTTGANDVYVIKLEDGRELLLPAIKDCILNVDLDKNLILINILEGLLD